MNGGGGSLFHRSNSEADQSIAEFLHTSNQLLDMFKRIPTWRLDEEALGRNVMNAGNDPYLHCVPTIFHLSFYYRADVAAVASTQHAIATHVWPQLAYVPAKYKTLLSPTLTRDDKPCRSGDKAGRGAKIRLGVASGAMTHSHSVVIDFSGVLQRLDRDIFDVTYIYFNENGSPFDEFVYKHREDKVSTTKKIHI